MMTRNHYKMLAERRKETIKNLTAQLQEERRLNKALSALAMHPKQDKTKLMVLRIAVTRREKVMGRRAA